MPALFLSHSKIDQQIADDMKVVLAPLGYETLSLVSDGAPELLNEIWETQINGALSFCQIVILILTSDWLASAWCYAEMIQARALGKIVLPVICKPLGEKFSLPEKAVELLIWNAEGLARLEERLGAITSDLARGDAAGAEPAQEPEEPRPDESNLTVAFTSTEIQRLPPFHSTSLTEQRVIRVFVSSTFRDMKAEREELIKRVFPELRKLCESRGVSWSEVDLRWGVTDEQKDEGQVLPICLAEVRACRPYFIGLLGDRYGWVDKFDQNLIAQEPWLAGHDGRSATELEIECGVLNNPKMADHAFFYFRDPAFSHAIEQKNVLTEKPLPLAAEKLASLKERIRKTGFPILENYKSIQELAKGVLADFKQLIDRLFPEGSVPDQLDREAALHETFAASRSQVFIGRRDYFDQLDAHARGAGPPLVVTGDSGLGKSALLANWVRRQRVAHPETFVFAHFLGASPASADWAALVRRLIGELNRRYRLSISIPDQPNALRKAFASALRKVASKHSMVIVLDAFNQLEDRDHARDLVWLPYDLPRQLRVVVSTLPGRPLDEIERRGWSKLELAPLTIEERRQVIVDYLAQYTKTLAPAQISEIASAPVSANPLFLTSTLEELRLWGEHETLQEQIRHYLSAPTIDDLFGKILTRYEHDYDREHPGLVRKAMSLIWAARHGLAEAELLDLLGSDGAPLPRTYWSPLSLAAGRSLVSHAGLLGFFHDYLRQAVRDQYLPTEAQQRDAHLRLADYFAARDVSYRKIDELPWQLTQAQAWERLRDVLADLPFFYAAWQTDPPPVRGYWTQVKDHIRDAPLDAYRAVLESPTATDLKYLWVVSALLQHLGYLKESLSLQYVLSTEYFKSEDTKGVKQLILSLNNQIGALFKLGLTNEAWKCCEMGLLLSRESGDQTGVALLTLARGDLLYKQNKLDDAMVQYQHAERLFRASGDRASVAVGLNKQATIIALNDKPAAVHILTEQAQIIRELGELDELTNCLGNLGTVLKQVGDFKGALTALKEQERLCRESGDIDEVQRSLANQATVHVLRRQWDEALELLKQQETICRRINNRPALADSLSSQALVVGAFRGHINAAIALLREREQLCRDIGDTKRIVNTLSGLAEFIERRGDVQGALAQLQEAEKLSHQLDDKSILRDILMNKATLFVATGLPIEAIQSLKEVETISRELQDFKELVYAIFRQAVLYSAMVKVPAVALPGMQQAQQLAEAHGLTALAEEIKNAANEIRARKS